MTTAAKIRKRPPRKDPDGGLTAEGRKHFADAEGAQLKPGVKAVRSPEDAKRKGSFLRRHYGKKSPSPLKDADGNPTRYALQAHAWGEPIPKTAADVKKLAEKGARLLERYHSATEAAPGGRAKSRAGKSGTSGKPAAAASRPGTRRTASKRTAGKAKAPGVARPSRSRTRSK